MILSPFRTEYLTEEERAHPLNWYYEGFTFKSDRLDLKNGLQISTNIYKKEDADRHLALAMMCFTSEWNRDVFRLLNGFSGFGSVKIEITHKD